MFLHLSVSHSVHRVLSALGGCLVRGVPGPGGSAPRGVCSWGVPGPGGVSARRGVPGAEGICSQGGGGWSSGGAWSGGVVETPRDGYCCGRYASYWNAFLFGNSFIIVVPEIF